ncbi:putative ribonuclease H-like domain-containing protein [Tanacetum coccineum]
MGPVSLDNSKNCVGNEPTNESSSQALVAQDGLGGYDWSNDFEVEPVNYALMAISSSSSSSSSDSENELAWGEKYEFQNYELKCREIKINNLNMELEKVVKERDELKDKIAKWEESSKNLDDILNSQMSARDKTGLGYGTQLNELSSNHETDSENSFSVFDVRSSDEESTPANDRSSKADGYHVVPPPITGNFLTPRADISFAGLDEYAIRNKIIESQTTELNTKTSETAGQTNDANTKKPKSVSESVPKINRDRVIIEDWNSDDEEEEYEVQTVRPKTQTVKTRDDKSGQTSKNKEFGLRECQDALEGHMGYYLDHSVQRSDHFMLKKGKSSDLVTGFIAVVDSDETFNFKLLDESQVVLRAPRKDDVYSLDLKNIVPSGGITCLYANATADESKLWHMRLGHVNFKNINKLVKGHLVRGLPSKVFVNDHTCVACKKGKQHKASCKAKLERIIRKPLELLHMDLFGPVSVESINKKRYCLVVTDDFSRFSWVFFLATKDETSEILCKFIIGLENQLNHNVKIIRCDNGTEFKNHAMNELCAKKGIKREFSVARTPQQNEAVNTACYVLNRVLVTKPQNKTPYELLVGNSPSISFTRPFGCPLTILNTLDSLGKFDGSNEGYLLGYSTSSKAFKVYNKRNKRVEENLHINFLEDQPNVTGTGPNWMFDLDFLTNSMNYIHVSVENQVNMDAGTQDSYVAGSSGKDKGPTQEYILLPLQPHRIRIPVEDVPPAAHEKPSKSSPKDNDVQDTEDAADGEEQHQMKESEQDLQDELEKMRRIASQKKAAQATNTNILSTDRSSVSTDRPFVSTDRPSVSTDMPFVSTDRPSVSIASTPLGINAGESSFVYPGGKIPIDASTLPNADLPIDPNMPNLEDASDTLPNDEIFNGAYDDDEDVGVVSDFNNMDNTIVVSPIPTLRIHKDHPKGQILGDPTSAVQTRGKIQKASSAQQALVSYIPKQNRTNHKDHQNCLFACFLSHKEPKTISQVLQDKSWAEAMQEELIQFKLYKVWVPVDLPYGKKVIGTKWVFRNKRDERSIVVKNKARLVAQGFKQEEDIDYDEVFAPVARIKAIRLFLAFASYMGFTVYQMDIKSVFLYGTIEEEVYVHQPLGFVDPAHPNKVYKVIKALYGLHQAPRAWSETLYSFLMENGFRRGTIDKTLFIKKNKRDIMLVQVYVDDIIFGSTKKSMCTEFEECMHKRFLMSSMGELTFFLGLQVKQQPDGIFISQDKYVAGILKKFNFLSIRTATTPIESNKSLIKDEDGVDVDVHVYKDSPFEVEAYSDSDYRGASLDRKSTTSGCQFLGKRLISWQCKKQTIMANSTTKTEYVAAANCCGQVLWIQNQMMDCGFIFMNTKIHIDNESTISVIKNLVAHSRTKNIEIRFHFIRYCYEKRLIEHIWWNILEKTDGNTEVHQIMDFLTCSSIYYALTVSPIVSTSFIEQFWMTAKSRTINNISYIDAIVAGKPVTISEASIRSDLLFDDVMG